MKKNQESKSKNFFKAIWKWVLKPIFWIAGILSIIFIGKKLYEKAVLGNVESGIDWNKIDDTTISVFDKNTDSYRPVSLPFDRRTGKQVKADDIKAVGISEKKVVVNVKINHNHITDVFMGNK